METCLEAALSYAGDFGWYVLPVAPRDKRPILKNWPVLATTDPETIRKWWTTTPDANLGVLLGAKSGIIDIEHDTDEGRATAERLLSEIRTPTYTSGRSTHRVFAYCDGLPGGAKIDVQGLEVRTGNGGKGAQSIFPPSIHPSGKRYEWTIPPEAVAVASIPDSVLALMNMAMRLPSLPQACYTEDTCNVLSVSSVSSVYHAPSVSSVYHSIEKAISESQPAAISHRNRQLFELARSLRAIPTLADAPVDTLETHVRRWHSLGVAQGVIGTEPFEETWIDFVTCWPKVKFPKGNSPMSEIMERAKRSPPPKAAERYEQAGLRLLVSLCRELQHAAATEPFFLSCRTAAEMLDVRNKNGGFDHIKAARWLFLLVHDKVLVEVEKGDITRRRASCYRYMGD